MDDDGPFVLLIIVENRDKEVEALPVPELGVQSVMRMIHSLMLIWIKT